MQNISKILFIPLENKCNRITAQQTQTYNRVKIGNLQHLTFIRESTKVFPSSKALSLPAVLSSPTLLFTSGMRMIYPESETLPQQARFRPNCPSLLWLPLLLSNPWKMLHSAAESRERLSPKAACCCVMFLSCN